MRVRGQLKDLFNVGPLDFSETHRELAALDAAPAAPAADGDGNSGLLQRHRAWLCGAGGLARDALGVQDGDGCGPREQVSGAGGDLGVRALSDYHLLFSKLATSAVGGYVYVCIQMSCLPGLEPGQVAVVPSARAYTLPHASLMLCPPA